MRVLWRTRDSKEDERVTRISWSRIVATGVLSALMVPVSWGLTLFATPGDYLGSLIVPATSAWISSGRMLTAAAVDFSLWFGFVWGLWGLWLQLRQCRGDDAAKRWANPFRHTATLMSAALCALPFPFYIVLAVDNGRMPGSVFVLMGGLVLALATCALAICGLFALVLRVWPEAWIPKGDSDKNKFTALNLPR